MAWKMRQNGALILLAVLAAHLIHRVYHGADVRLHLAPAVAAEGENNVEADCDANPHERYGGKPAVICVGHDIAVAHGCHGRSCKVDGLLPAPALKLVECGYCNHVDSCQHGKGVDYPAAHGFLFALHLAVEVFLKIHANAPTSSSKCAFSFWKMHQTSRLSARC